MTILEMVRDIMVDLFGAEGPDITLSTHLGNYLTDPLREMEMFFALEEHFSVTITVECWNDLATIGDVVELLEELKK